MLDQSERDADVGLPELEPQCSSLTGPRLQLPVTVGSEKFVDPALPTSLVSTLREFKDMGLLCDVELIVENRPISAHRVVLAAAIPYFRAMFSCDMLEKQSHQITINDISYDAMRLLVDYVYKCEIYITSGNVQQLIFAASILQMDSVCGACQRFMTQYLTTSNCLVIRQFAEQHNCSNLMNSTDDFAVEHFAELRTLSHFRSIPFTHLRDLICRSDLKVDAEQEGNRACVDHVSEAVFELLKQRDLGPSAIGSALLDDGGSSQYSAGSSSHQYSPVHASHSQPTIRPRNCLAGVIFCVGGRGTAGDPFRSVEAFDCRRNLWFTVPEMTVQRRHVGVVSAQGKLYAIGGHDGAQHLATAECFDPDTTSWKKVCPMKTSRRGIAVGALGDVIYAVGGLDDSTCFQTVERYDIDANTWTTVTPMNLQRGGVGVAALGKFMFAVGGNDGTSSLDSCERYDPVLDKWKVVAKMANRRAGAGVCVLDGTLYAIGGFDDNSPLSSCEKYHPQTDEWIQLAPMSCARGGVGVASMGGLVYAIGGHDGTRYLNSVEAYDPTSNTWKPMAPIRECRAGAGVAWADCRVDDLLHPSHTVSGSGCAPGGTSSNLCV